MSANDDASTSTPGTFPRSPAYFPHRTDFTRREDGSAIWASLKGPARIEAREQEARERVLHGADLKLLQERLRWCYHKEGVNHYETCKDIADAYYEKLRTSDSWLLQVRPPPPTPHIHTQKLPPPPALRLPPRQAVHPSATRPSPSTASHNPLPSPPNSSGFCEEGRTVGAPFLPVGGKAIRWRPFTRGRHAAPTLY